MQSSLPLPHLLLYNGEKKFLLFSHGKKRGSECRKGSPFQVLLVGFKSQFHVEDEYK